MNSLLSFLQVQGSALIKDMVLPTFVKIEAAFQNIFTGTWETVLTKEFLISFLVASIPIIIWFIFLFKRSERSKKTVALVFLLGCSTAPILLMVQYFWQIFPEFNLAVFIEENITQQSAMFAATFILFAGMEEIIKLYMVRVIDKRTVLIKTINDAIHYSFVSALGFSFIENCYYLYQFYPQIELGQLIGMYIFRSIFTTCAHLIFSGIFGYYYGISRFAIDINKNENLSGKMPILNKIISKIFRVPISQSYQQKMILKGLVTAIGIHAIHNYLLQFNIILPVIAFDILGFIFLRYLLSRKTGHLLLSVDISEKRKSDMAKKDEDVVLELLGMWFQDKKYVDVLHICERLLERDPDNNVVKLFKAQAIDSMKNTDVYKSILGTVLKTKDDISDNDRNIIEKHLEQKEALKKANS